VIESAPRCCEDSNPYEPCWGAVEETNLSVSSDDGPIIVHTCEGHRNWPATYEPEGTEL
jgi:hypothetical protein